MIKSWTKAGKEKIMVKKNGTFAQKSSEQKARILLLVDRDLEQLARMSKFFRKVGYETVTARGGREAINAVQTVIPDIVLTALNPGKMNGLAFVELLKQNQNTKHTPCIVIRESQDIIEEEDCCRSGARACLSRPISLEKMYQAVQTSMEKNPRGTIRLQTLHPVKVETAPFCDQCGMHTLALSERGMFLYSTRKAPLNARFAVRINVKGSIIPVEARVLYNGMSRRGSLQEPGMGLEFVKIALRDQELIRMFINSEVMQDIQAGAAFQG